MTMMSLGVKSIKRAQKESLFFREISRLFTQAIADDPRLITLTITRTEFSSDKGTCWVYFYTAGGLPEFQSLLEILKLYKPSLRSALSKAIHSRYTPELVFKFDDLLEKESKMNTLLDSLDLGDDNESE